MFSFIHSLAWTGVSFQPLLQVETNSTSDEPLPSMEAWKAFFSAFLALLIEATDSTDCRVT